MMMATNGEGNIMLMLGRIESLYDLHPTGLD